MMNRFAMRSLRIGVLATMTAVLGACTTVLLPPNIAPVVAPSKSVEEANRRLAEVAAVRTQVEAEYAASEAVCYTKFFVNNCLDEAKEKRRSALAYQKAVEVEAETFIRRAQVEQRDRDVEQALKEFEAKEAKASATPPVPRAAAEPKPPSQRTSLAERKAAQDAKLAKRAAQEQADAPKRAASAREFEQRRLDSLERQKKVEEKKAEKAAKAAKEAAAKPAEPAK